MSKVQVWPDDLLREDVQVLIGGMDLNDRHILGVALLSLYGGD